MGAITLPNAALRHLGDISIDVFLETVWQKKPLFIPKAVKHFPQLDPNVLAGLALEMDVESRLVIQNPMAGTDKNNWQLEHGPFPENRFETLPQTHWTLLVQAVDHLLPEFAALLRQFEFVPRWRLDDIMVSYAVDQGSVGPHFDYYDVFLLQAEGVREWKLGQRCSANSPLVDGAELKILQQFETTETFRTEPGDLLYIPPNIAHWGVAQGECMTYSIGFRAPSCAEALSSFADYLLEQNNEDDRYVDPGRPLSQASAITATDVNKLKTLFENALNTPQQLEHWLAQHMTTPKRDTVAFEPEQAYTLLANVRVAYVAIADNLAALYIDGERFDCDLDLAMTLCQERQLTGKYLNGSYAPLITRWQDEGWLSH